MGDLSERCRKKFRGDISRFLPEADLSREGVFGSAISVRIRTEVEEEASFREIISKVY